MAKKQTPEDSQRNRLDSDLPDLSELATDTHIVNTGEAVREAVGSEMIGAQSFAEAKTEVSTAHLPEVAEVVEKKNDDDDETEQPKESPTEPTEVEADVEPEQKKGRRTLKEMYDDDKTAGRISAGAGIAAALPAFWYGSGISALPWGIAGLSSLAVAAPVIAYNLAEKQEHKSIAGISGLAVSGGIMAAKGVTLSTVGTAASALALPATAAYVGYKIGKSKKHPVIGGLVGAGAGMMAAPAVSGAITGITGGGWAALGGTVAGAGVGVGIPLGVAAATWYGIKKWKKRGKKPEITQ